MNSTEGNGEVEFLGVFEVTLSVSSSYHQRSMQGVGGGGFSLTYSLESRDHSKHELQSCSNTRWGGSERDKYLSVYVLRAGGRESPGATVTITAFFETSLAGGRTNSRPQGKPPGVY